MCISVANTVTPNAALSLLKGCVRSGSRNTSSRVFIALEAWYSLQPLSGYWFKLSMHLSTCALQFMPCFLQNGNWKQEVENGMWNVRSVCFRRFRLLSFRRLSICDWSTSQLLGYAHCTVTAARPLYCWCV